MQNLERQKFEESWKSAFDGAEMTPSDSVWNGLEVRLASEDNAVMKKRVVFYQRLAAGLTVFALLSGAYAFFSTQQEPANQLAASQQTVPQPTQSQPDNNTASDNTPDNQVTQQHAANEQLQASASSPSTSGVDRTTATNSTQRVASQRRTNSSRNNTNQTQPVDLSTTPSLAVIDTDDKTEELTDFVVTPTEATQVAVVDTNAGQPKEDPTSVVSEPEVATLLSADQINALAEEQHAKEKKEKMSAERMWLGMGAAAGSYNPGASLSPTSVDAQSSGMDAMFATSNNLQAPKSQERKLGSAYSVGMSVGTRLGKRWILQGGLNLLRQQTEHTSNFASVSSSNSRKSSVEEYYDASSAVSLTTPYPVNSAIEIVTVPVQAGYMIIDRRLGWQMNAGLSQDFFIRNTLTDKSGNLEKFSQGAGDDSPYRSLNWAALLSSELSYRIGENYRVSLVPGMRYSLKPMLKDSNEKGTPLVMDVGFRLKYLFN